MRIYRAYTWLVLASLFLHISTVATGRSSSRSSSSRSSSSSSSSSRSSSSSSWGSNSSPSYSSSSSSWRSNSSPSYSSSTSYSPSSWRSNSSPSYSSSSSSSTSFSSNSRSWGTSGTSNNVGSSSYSSSTTNFNPSVRTWGNTKSSRSSNTKSGSGINSSSSSTSYKPGSRSPSYSSSSSSSSSPSSSGSSKNEDNGKSRSKASSSGASKNIFIHTPSSSSNTNGVSSSSSSHRPSNNVHSRTVFNVLGNRNIIRNTTANATSYRSFYRSPPLNQTILNNPTNRLGSIAQNLNTMPLHAAINLNNNQRSSTRRPYYGDAYHTYSNYDEQSLETPPYSPEDDWQSSYYTTEWPATERKNYLPIDKGSKPIKTEKICRNVIQSEYNERDAYVESINKICEPEITPHSSLTLGATTSPTVFPPIPYALKNDVGKDHTLNNSTKIFNNPVPTTIVYEKVIQSEFNERDAVIESIKEICEAEFASTTTQTPVETTTTPPTSTTYFIDYKNRKPSKLVIMPTLADATNCRKVMKSELNEEGQIVDIVEQICDPPSASETTKAASLTVVKDLPNILNVSNKTASSDEQHVPDSMHGSNSGHVKQGVDALEIICRKITQSELSKHDTLFASIKEICEAEITNSTPQILVETTTMPPTSTTYFIDYKNRKPSKLVIMPTLEDATNCRKILHSDINEEGQIVDTVTQICDPPTTTETTMTTTMDKLIPLALKVSNEQQERLSTSVINSAHRNQSSDPLKIICERVMQSEVKDITDTLFETTTMPPTSTTYFIDKKKRKPSKLVIIPTPEGATNCRKILHSDIDEEGQIVDTVAQICDPLQPKLNS